MQKGFEEFLCGRRAQFPNFWLITNTLPSSVVAQQTDMECCESEKVSSDGLNFYCINLVLCE